MLNEDVTLIATFVAIAITLTGVVWTGVLTRQSNKIMEKDLMMRHRPWVIIEQPKVEIAKINSDTDSTKLISVKELINIPHEKLSSLGKTEFHWKVECQNIGSTPATNFSISMMDRWDKEITIDELKKEYPNFPKTTYFLSPQESSQYPIRFDVENWEKDIFRYFWAGLILRYQFEDHLHNTQRITNYKIWKFKTVSWELTHSSFIQE